MSKSDAVQSTIANSPRLARSFLLETQSRFLQSRIEQSQSSVNDLGNPYRQAKEQDLEIRSKSRLALQPL